MTPSCQGAGLPCLTGAVGSIQLRLAALLAQLVEQLTLNQRVVGSSPTQGIFFFRSTSVARRSGHTQARAFRPAQRGRSAALSHDRQKRACAMHRWKPRPGKHLRLSPRLLTHAHNTSSRRLSDLRPVFDEICRSLSDVRTGDHQRGFALGGAILPRSHWQALRTSVNPGTVGNLAQLADFAETTDRSYDVRSRGTGIDQNFDQNSRKGVAKTRFFVHTGT